MVTRHHLAILPRKQKHLDSSKGTLVTTGSVVGLCLPLPAPLSFILPGLHQVQRSKALAWGRGQHTAGVACDWLDGICLGACGSPAEEMGKDT